MSKREANVDRRQKCGCRASYVHNDWDIVPDHWRSRMDWPWSTHHCGSVDRFPGPDYVRTATNGQFHWSWAVERQDNHQLAMSEEWDLRWYSLAWLKRTIHWNCKRKRSRELGSQRTTEIFVAKQTLVFHSTNQRRDFPGPLLVFGSWELKRKIEMTNSIERSFPLT